MSIISSKINNNNMSKNSFFDLRKQASFYIKEKIKTARLALTDVTPIQLMTEEATNPNPWAPNTQTLGSISRAAFEVDDYWRIVDILHTKLSKFEKKEWRATYNSLIVLEHLLTHGPERIAEEFQTHKSIINDMKYFQHIDEKGFNWGITVRKKSEKIATLLENTTFLKEERENARKLTREIKGFGSFSEKSASVLDKEQTSTTFGRSHSQFNEHCNDENHVETNGFFKAQRTDAVTKRGSVLHSWSNNKIREENSLLCGNGNEIENKGRMSVDEEEEEEDRHPFSSTEKYSRMSLLDAAM